MPEEGTGTIHADLLADGTRSFRLRVRANGERERITLHERRGCVCGCGGGWDEPAARTELGNILARVRAGVWERPEPPATLLPDESDEVPTYLGFSDWWLEAKVDGTIGEGPISENTESDYDWRLGYSRRFFGDTPIDEIERKRSLAFKAHLLKEAREQRKAIEAGADLRDPRGRRIVPLGPSSIKKILDTFASVLDEAIEEEHRDDNPARSKRMQVKVPKPKRTFLEMDELGAVLDAARDQDVRLPDLATVGVEEGSTAERVVRLAAQGRRPKQIAEDLTLAVSTVTHHLRRHDINVGRGYVGRRVVCEILGRGGLRVSELCDLKIGKVRVHGPNGARLRIEDAKTETGERIVELTPDLAEAIVEHVDRLRRAGQPTGPNDYLVPNLRGGRISRQRIGKIVKAAADLASERLQESGLPPLPGTTPHTLRRTYISIALLANEFDVLWVMKQVGHADSKMTTDVYAQLQQRVERHHGAKFDQLVRRAKAELAGVVKLPTPDPAAS